MDFMGIGVMRPHPTHGRSGQPSKMLWLQIGCKMMADVSNPEPGTLSRCGSTVRLKLSVTTSGNRMPPLNSMSITLESAE